MTKWNQTFRIDDIWKKRNGECGPEDWTDKTVHELAKEIARRIQRKWPEMMLDGDGDCDFNLVEIYDWFMAVPTMSQYKLMLKQIMKENLTDEEYLEWSKRTPMVEFNEGMSMFYDWCDRERVWVDK